MRMLDRLYQGAKQNIISSPIYQRAYGDQSKELERMKSDEGEKTRIYQGLEKQHPIATTVGEIAPLLAGLPAVGGLGSAALTGAVTGYLEYGTPEEKKERALYGAAGGAAGAGIGKLMGRAAQPIRTAPSETTAAAEAAAGRIGVDLRAGELTGSRPVRWMESALNDMPFSAGMAQRGEQARREAINAAGAKAMGQPPAAEITEAVFSQARQDIGGVFQNLLSNRRIELDGKFRADVKKIADSKVMPALKDESAEAIIAPFQNMPPGTIRVSGEWFQQNKTALDQAIRAAYNNSQPGRAMALEKFEDALVDAAKRSMNTTERAAYEAAQKQWASLRMLETGRVVDAGNIQPGRLNAALINRYKGAYKEGKIQGELADIGKLGEVYKPLPQSGTVPRAVYSVLAAGAGAINPPLAAAQLALPALMQAVLQSSAGKKYLTQGLMDVTPEVEKRLMQGGYGLFGPAMAGY